MHCTTLCVRLEACVCFAVTCVTRMHGLSTGWAFEPPFWPDFWDRGRACARGVGMLSAFILCCNFCACKCACTVVVRSPRGGWGTVTWQPSPRGWWGTVFPGVGNDKGGGVPISIFLGAVMCPQKVVCLWDGPF